MKFVSMIKNAALTVALGAALLTTPAAHAQNEDALVTYQSLKPSVALELAQSALTICRDAGYQVAITVTDRFGVSLVMLRDQYAGTHTVSTATRKAWTAVTFRTSTIELNDVAATNKHMTHIGDITNALALGGGVPVLAGGVLVGGIGISGAPGAELDHDCAIKAIETIQDDLDF